MKADWKLLAAFTALLLLIVAIGFIGIFQIQSLSKTVDNLGKSYIPMQEAVLEMRVNNSLYARGIRNYVFWKSSRYLGAARAGADLGVVQEAIGEFDRHLEVYSSHIRSLTLPSPQRGEGFIFAPSSQRGEGRGEGEQWVQQIASSEKELREIGSRIISLVDQDASHDSVNKLIMVFESQLYRIDEFLDGTVQDLNLKIIRTELEGANLRKTQAIFSLGWSLALAILIGGETAWFVYRGRKRERERREQLVQRMIKFEEENRANLSLQVHDQMGQDLSALRIYLDLADKNIPPEFKEAKKNAMQSRELLSGLIEKSHNISELLRPPALDEVGLVDTISALVFQYRQMTGMKFTYEKPKKGVKFPGEYSLLLYRAAQEGFTNITKHSKAKNVYIKLQVLANSYQLTIEDDGVGFDYRRFMEGRRKSNKLGIMGLEERIELLRGKMSVETSHGKGTKLTVRLPVAK